MDDKAEPPQQQQGPGFGRSANSNNDDTLVNDDGEHRIILEDWSQTGRGSHIDLDEHDNLPLEQGRFLGRGATGDVYETIVQGWKLAHKRILFRQDIGTKEMKEIEILKKISHIHVLQLIGTYTQQRVLGILLYPVAACDLYTFFEDVEAWSRAQGSGDGSTVLNVGLDAAHKARLEALDYDFPAPGNSSKASLIYAKIGCIISAVEYLHKQKIRHKDLKPSNILLSRGKLWLSDFGSATDFSSLSQSATDNERGTPRYFAPEVAAYERTGRAADIFSLGCVLLEILVLDGRGTLQHLRDNRSSNPCYHANLDKIEIWLAQSQPFVCPQRSYLESEVRRMLSKEPDKRPTIEMILQRAAASNMTNANPAAPSIFGDCCHQIFVHRVEHQRRIADLIKNCDAKIAGFESALISQKLDFAEQIKKANDEILYLRSQVEKPADTIVLLERQSVEGKEGSKDEKTSRMNAEGRVEYLERRGAETCLVERRERKVEEEAKPKMVQEVKEKEVDDAKEVKGLHDVEMELITAKTEEEERKREEKEKKDITKAKANVEVCNRLSEVIVKRSRTLQNAAGVSTPNQETDGRKATSQDRYTTKDVKKLGQQTCVESAMKRSRSTLGPSKEELASQPGIQQRNRVSSKNMIEGSAIRGIRLRTPPSDDGYSSPHAVRFGREGMTITNAKLFKNVEDPSKWPTISGPYVLDKGKAREEFRFRDGIYYDETGQYETSDSSSLHDPSMQHEYSSYTDPNFIRPNSPVMEGRYYDGDVIIMPGSSSRDQKRRAGNQVSVNEGNLIITAGKYSEPEVRRAEDGESQLVFPREKPSNVPVSHSTREQQASEYTLSLGSNVTTQRGSFWYDQERKPRDRSALDPMAAPFAPTRSVSCDQERKLRDHSGLDPMAAPFTPTQPVGPSEEAFAARQQDVSQKPLIVQDQRESYDKLSDEYKRGRGISDLFQQKPIDEEESNSSNAQRVVDFLRRREKYSWEGLNRLKWDWREPKGNCDYCRHISI